MLLNNQILNFCFEVEVIKGAAITPTPTFVALKCQEVSTYANK